MALPATPSISIRPLAEDSALTYYWYGSPASTFTLDISGGMYASTFTFSNSVFYKVTGLTNGELYSANLINNNGSTSSRPASYRTVQPGNKPGNPQSAAIVKEGDRLRISWEPPASDGGAVVGWYVVKDPANSNLRYNTYGVNSNITIPYTTGHDSIILQAVNDPGYSPGILLRVGGASFTLFNIFVGDNGNYYYQIYDLDARTFGEGIDSGVNSTDFNANNDEPQCQMDGSLVYKFNSKNPIDGYYQQIYQIIGTNGSIKQTIQIPDTYKGVTSNTTLFTAYSQNVSTFSTMNTYLFHAPTNTYRSSSIPFDYTTEQIRNVDCIQDALTFNIYSSNTNNFIRYMWYKDWITPSSIYTCSQLSTRQSDSNTGSLLTVTKNSSNVWDKFLLISQGGYVSTFNLPENSYTNINANDYFGVNDNSFYAVMNNSNTLTYDFFLFRNLPTTDYLVLPHFASTINNNYNIYRNSSSDSSYITNITNNIMITEQVTGGQFLSPVIDEYIYTGNIYTVLENESFFRSTIFGESNYFRDTVNLTKGMGAFVYFTPSSICAAIIRNDGESRIVLDDITNVSTYPIQNTFSFDSNFGVSIQSTNTAIYTNTIIDISGNTHTYQTSQNYNYRYSGTNFIQVDSATSTLYYYSTNYLQSTPIFLGEYNIDFGRGDYPEVSSISALWYTAYDQTSLSTICFYNGSLGPAVGIPFNGNGSYDTSYTAYGDVLCVYNYTNGSSNVTTSVFYPDGTLKQYTDTEHSTNISGVNQPNSTDRLIIQTFTDNDTNDSFNIIYDRVLSTFTSTTTSATSTNNVFINMTNYPYDVYWDWY